MSRFGPRGLAALVTVLLALSASAFPASAHPFTKADGDDTKGPLDLASVSVTHDENTLLFTFTTFNRWRITNLGSRSYFLALIDTDLDDVAERCAFIYSHGGVLDGALTNCGRKVLSSPEVLKPSPTTGQISLCGSCLGTHRWAAVSVYDESLSCEKTPCVDAVPNRRPVFHDLEPPTAGWLTTTPYHSFSTGLSMTTTVPVEFWTQDADTEVIEWSIQRSVDGTWVDLLQGTGAGAGTHDLTLEEGQRYMLRPTATDAHGNVGAPLVPSLVLSVPFDDVNPVCVYAGDVSAGAGVGAFQGTAHTLTAGSSVTFDFPVESSASYLQIYGGPGSGSAAVTIDGVPRWTIDETAATPMGTIVYSASVPKGLHSATVTVTSGTIIFDAFILYVV